MAEFARILPAGLNPSMRTNSGDTCRAAALKNKGVVLQPSFMVGDDLRSGALVELMPQYRSLEFGVYAICPTRQYVAPKVKALVDFLARALREVTWQEAASLAPLHGVNGMTPSFKTA